MNCAMPVNLLQSQPPLPMTSRPVPPAPRLSTAAPGANDEAAAIRQTLAGDVNAFNRLVIVHQGYAYSVAYRILQNREAATDAVQDSFVKAFRALTTFNGSSFRAWLTRIVVNTCYDVLKSAHYRTTIGLGDLLPETDEDADLPDSAERPEAYVQRTELRQWIELGIRALPADQRVAVVLSDIQGYSYDEIVEMTGASLGTVKSRISRGRARLRDFLLEQPERLPAAWRSVGE